MVQEPDVPLESLPATEDLVGDSLHTKLEDEMVQVLEIVAQDGTGTDVPDPLDGIKHLLGLLDLIQCGLDGDVTGFIAPGLQLQVVAVRELEPVHIVCDGLSTAVCDGERLHLMTLVP